MFIKDKKKKQRLSLIFPALAFFVAAYGSITESGDYVFGLFYGVVGVVNLLLLRYIEKQTLLTGIIVNALNMIASVVVGVQFLYAGKVYIPYAYFIIAVMYLVITIRFVIKYRHEIRSTA